MDLENTESEDRGRMQVSRSEDISPRARKLPSGTRRGKLHIRMAENFPKIIWEHEYICRGGGGPPHLAIPG